MMTSDEAYRRDVDDFIKELRHFCKKAKYYALFHLVMGLLLLAGATYFFYLGGYWQATACCSALMLGLTGWHYYHYRYFTIMLKCWEANR